MIDKEYFFELAQLAEASYADLAAIVGKPGLVAALQDYSFNKMEFSDTQANALADSWSVTTHQKDTSSGFSSTLFQNVHDGSYVLAFLRHYYKTCQLRMTALTTSWRPS